MSTGGVQTVSIVMSVGQSIHLRCLSQPQASAAWAIRSTFHTTLGATPGQLVYGRDMLFDLSFKANWKNIKERKKESAN
jgi:hypothetical protein